MRARKRRRSYEEEAGHLAIETNAAIDPAIEAERLDEIQRVRRVLANMKPRNAKILILRYSGLSYSELANTLGVRAGSIGTMLVRAEAEFEKRYQQSF